MAARNEHWLVAYAIGIAFSVVDDDAARGELLAVTSDPALLLRARSTIGAVTVVDPATRERATELLERAAGECVG